MDSTMLSMESLIKHDKPHPKINESNPLTIPPNHILPLSYDLIKPWRLPLHPPIKEDQHLPIGGGTFKASNLGFCEI